MRIVYCNKFNFAFSGTEAHLFELMDLVRDHGHETALFSMLDSRGPATSYDRFFVPHIDFRNGKQGLAERARLAAHVVYSPDAGTRLRRMLAEFRPDIAHVRNIYHHLSPSILWELRGQHVPVLYHLNDFKLLCPNRNLTAHGEICERCRNGQFWRVIAEDCHPTPRGSALVLAAEAYVHRWLRTYQKCVDCFLVPSEFAKNKLAEFGWDAEKIQVLPHFQRLRQFPAPEPTHAAPILYFGRLSEEKGVADLLRALRLVAGARAQIAGDGPQRQELENLARELAVPVDFVGHQAGTDLDRLIASAYFTVFPSRAYETLGKSILESFAWGRPVVASDLGSRRELVHHGRTGLLFPPGDEQRLAEAISYLRQNPVIVAEMGTAAREMIRQRHSPEMYYRELNQLYEELRARKKSAPFRPVRPALPKLRVAMIGGRGVISKYGGIETCYEEVGKRLVEMGHEVTVYCRSYFTPKLKQHYGMRLVRLPTIRSKHLDTLVHTLLSTLHAMCSGCDIVHYQALGPALFAFLPRLAGKKTVVTVQGLDWQRKKWGRIASTVLRLGEFASACWPNATIVVSRILQQHYRARFGVEPFYVPNGASIRKSSHPSRLRQWGLQPGRYILFAGRFSPEKNCHLLIEAYEKIDTRVKLVLAGGSSYSDGYLKLLRARQSERLLVLDWLSGTDFDELLANAMLFVLPSEVEGLSLALLDAMGAGVCVLTSDIPENSEVVEGVGFTFIMNDVGDLERMLRLLISDARMRRVSGRSAQQRVREGYLWPRVAELTAAIYQQLMKTRPEAEAGGNIDAADRAA